MALVLKDRVVESSTSSGTGAFTLNGAETGYQSFSVVGDGSTVYYTIQSKDSSGVLTGEWEVGIGTYSANILTRSTVLESSNSNALVSFTSGLKDVFIDLPAEKAVYLDIDNITNTLGGVQFDVNPSTVPTTPGSLYWDSADGNQTLSLVMAGGTATQQIGEEYYYRIKASSAITDGQVVMFTGTVGNSGALQGAPATGLTASTASYVMGIATQDIAHNGWGYITAFGLVRNLNTTGGAEAWVDGQILYYDPAVAGGLTKTIPSAPNAKVQVCAVIKAGTNGSLFVRPSFGGSLGQYEGDVGISGQTNGQSLIWSTNKWVNSNANVINGGTIDNTPIGATTASTGSFTTLIGGADAANYGQLTGGATTKAIEWKSLGSDTNVAFAIRSKGTGAIDLAAGSSGVNISNGGTVTAITRTSTGSNYTSAPTVSISAPTTAGGVQATATVQMFAGGGTVASGGSGYAVNDTVTITGYGSNIVVTVTTVSSGAITAYTVISGALTSIPTNPVSQSSTSGSGTGATFNLTYGMSTSFTITNAGSGYIEQPTVSFSGGGGSGASAYASVGAGSVIRALGQTTTSALSFYTAGGEVLRIRDSGSSGTYLMAQSSSTGVSLGTQTSGFLSVYSSSGAISFGTNGTSGQTQFNISHTASAVNYVQVTGAATGNQPSITAQGSDANINMNFQAKGSGTLIFNTNGAEQLRLGTIASTVNNITISGATATNAPALSVRGSDTNIDLALTPKGTGLVRFGTLTANADAPITGYITIKDSAGTTRKLAVIA